MSETQSEGPTNANLQPGANYNLVGLTARSGRSTLYYIPVDATLALDQSISPQWSSVHTFLGGIGFGAPGAASMNLEQGVSLKYSVGQGVHAFYVDGKAVGQIDDPSNPMPSSNAPSSSAGAIATDFRNPSTSVNHSRTNRISRSSSVRSTNSFWRSMKASVCSGC